MKYKKILIIVVVIMCLSGTVYVVADSIATNYPYVAIYNSYGLYLVCTADTSTVYVTENNGTYTWNTTTYMMGRKSNNPVSPLANVINFYINGGFIGQRVQQATATDTIITLRGKTLGASNVKNKFQSTYNDYIESLKPKWYETMWDTISDYFTNPVPFQWFKNLIDKIFGNNNNGGTIADNVNISEPTFAPTPTPIPYSTVVIPKTDIITGDTVYETNYYYVNPSGTPIITSSPPTNTPSSGGGGGSSTEYVPIGGDPFSIPAVNWLTSATIGDSTYDGIDSINDGMGSIDSIGSEYSDGMSAVQDSTGTLPTSWLLLIGIAAAIPLLAGIVSRFLGG